MIENDLYVSPWWQSSCIPNKWDVAGVEVFSLSLWHLFALEQIGNAYVCGGIPDRDSAASLLLFAETDMAGGRRLLLEPYRRARKMRRMYRRLRHSAWADLHLACEDFVKSCLRSPDHWEDDKKGGTLSAPYQFHMVRCLCAEYGMPLADAWNMPYAMARCYFDAWQESQGDKTLVSSKAQSLIDRKQGE